MLRGDSIYGLLRRTYEDTEPRRRELQMCIINGKH